MDSESMNRYRYENDLVYTQEQVDEILNGIKDMFGLQIQANDGTLLVSVEKYNKFVDLVGEI